MPLSDRERLSAWADGFMAATAEIPWCSPFGPDSEEYKAWREGLADGQGLRSAGYATIEQMPEDIHL
jgi:hypothetical protein